MEQNNIFNKNRIFKSGIPEYKTLSESELKELLLQTSGYIRARSIIELSSRGELQYAFDQMQKVENQGLTALFGFNVAQISALAIIDYGNMSDIKNLKLLMDKWINKQQKDDFIDYLKKNGINLDEI